MHVEGMKVVEILVIDRIEVVSVGGLPEGLSLSAFYEGKSKPVNLALQQIMVR